MRATVICVALAFTPGIAWVYMAAIAAAEGAGGTWLAARTPANIAEAAATARADLVVRFLDAGEDPGRVYPLHPDVISSTVRHATALEAAVWSHQRPLIELLDREGVIPGSGRQALACLAVDVGVDDIVAYLSPAAPPDCVRGEAIGQVTARTAR